MVWLITTINYNEFYCQMVCGHSYEILYVQDVVTHFIYQLTTSNGSLLLGHTVYLVLIINTAITAIKVLNY